MMQFVCGGQYTPEGMSIQLFTSGVYGIDVGTVDGAFVG